MLSYRHSRAIFLVFFIIVGLVMKMVSEVVHEVVGHGTFVAVLGGSIQDIYISILWPYEMSYMTASWPATVTDAQLVFFYSGGILFSLVTSFLVLLLLLHKETSSLWLELPLFWLAFWCLLSAAGYLIIGGFSPFGDVMWLTSHGFVTSTAAILIGTFVFLLGFFLLQPVLKRNFAKVFTEARAKLAVSIFWLTVPIATTLAVIGRGTLPAFVFLPVSLIPLVLSLIVEYWPSKNTGNTELKRAHARV